MRSSAYMVDQWWTIDRILLMVQMGNMVDLEEWYRGELGAPHRYGAEFGKSTTK